MLAFMLDGAHVRSGNPDDYIYVAMNTHWEMHGFELPGLPDGRQWHVSTNTSMESPQDIWEPGSEPLLDNQHVFLVGPRSLVILVGR